MLAFLIAFLLVGFGLHMLAKLFNGAADALNRVNARTAAQRAASEAVLDWATRDRAARDAIWDSSTKKAADKEKGLEDERREAYARWDLWERRD